MMSVQQAHVLANHAIIRDSQINIYHLMTMHYKMQHIITNAHNQNSGLQVSNNKTSDYVRIYPRFQLQRSFYGFYKS